MNKPGMKSGDKWPREEGESSGKGGGELEMEKEGSPLNPQP